MRRLKMHRYDQRTQICHEPFRLKQYLLQAIESRRQCVKLSDPELTKLLTDVQRARDDRSLLLDALERLLVDLRSQPHSAAFLARVNKRDAPDYYDVIKNPMDLGLMLKNVKGGKYRTKEAFKRDLDLIWDNCLLYNTEPSHPLRISANLMRKRSHDLLSYIQDSNDVKSALTEWVSTHTSLTPAEAKAMQKGEPVTPTSGPPLLPVISTLDENRKNLSGPAADLTDRAAGKQPVRGTLTPSTEEEPFEKRAAILIASASRIAEAAVEERRRGERDNWALKSILGENWDATRVGRCGSRLGEGRRSCITQPVFEAQDEEKEVENIVRTLAAGQLIDIFGGSSSSLGLGAGEPSISVPRMDVLLPRLPSSLPGWNPTSSLTYSDGLKRKRLPNKDAMTPMPMYDQKRRRGVDVIKENIATLKRMKRLKDKFEVLELCLENEMPLPGSLLIDTDDDEDDAERRAPRSGDSNRARAKARVGTGETWHHLDASRQQNWSGQYVLQSDISSSHPYPHLNRKEARSRLAERVGLLIGNVGFEAFQARPVDILNSVAEEFLLSLGRTLRLYVDRYGSSMTSEEILLHAMHATSSMQASDLDRYVYDDTFRYQNRLQDLREKLEASWKGRVAIGEERLATEEDARFFGEESEDLVAGNLPSALDDDFFGFKALGLDQELGLANLQVPLRLLQRRGVGSRRAGVSGLGQKEEAKDPFSPPPPFVRLSEAAISVQIGLLRPYYSDLLQRRGHRGRHNGEDGVKLKDVRGEGIEYESQEAGDEEDDILALSDEEQERTSRYKVPPTGKMPRQNFWSPNSGTVQRNKMTAQTTATAGGAAKGSNGSAVISASRFGNGAATSAKGSSRASIRGRKKGKKE